MTKQRSLSSKPLIIHVALLCLGPTLVGCGLRDDETEMIDVETATQVAALTVYEGEAADEMEPTLDEPVVVTDCDFDHIRQEVVKRFDENGDGEVTGQERQNLTEAFGTLPKQAKRAVLWAKALRHHGELLRRVYDMDNSGELSADEKADLRADLETRCEARRAQALAKFDVNADGKLDADEALELVDYLKGLGRDKYAEILTTYDTDGDNKLNDEERLVLRDDRKEKLKEIISDLADEYDVDDDGDLSLDEQTALREYLQEWVRGEHFGERK